jgi:hypothetical protein
VVHLLQPLAQLVRTIRRFRFSLAHQFILGARFSLTICQTNM